MNFYEEIEPIHELPSDELERLLDHVLENLKFIWSKERDDSLKDIWHDIDFDLQTIIHSIKKSLLYFYPTCEFDLSYVVDANEAMHYLSILEHNNPLTYGLIEGVNAVFKIYLQIGFYYPCDPQDIGLLDFKEMEAAVLKYANIARFYYHHRVMREARPLVEEGKKRKEQLKAPRDKRNKILLKAISLKLKGKSYRFASDLMRSFPNRNKQFLIDGRNIYKIENTIAGKEIEIIIIEPDGTRLTFDDRAFRNYVEKVEEEIKIRERVKNQKK